METAAIPFTAWQQAAIVVLCLLFCLALLRYFLRFIEKRDQQWQKYLSDQREADRCARAEDNTAIENLVAEVRKLADEMVKLRADFQAHDTMEREVLRRVADEPKTGRRRTGASD